MEPNAVAFHFWFHKSYKHMNPSFNQILNSFHQQWWCCSISFGEWRKGIEAWATSDSKDQWIRWCCSGTIVVFVYLNKMSHWRSWKLKILFLISFVPLCLHEIDCAGTRIIYNCSCSCDSKSYFKCWLGSFSNWLLRNQWSLCCKPL